MKMGNSTPERSHTPKASPSRIYIVSNGCHENFMDAALLKRFLSEKHGFLICNSYADADIILVMGCAATQHTENESRYLIDHFKQNIRHDARVFTLGCISKYKPEIKNNGLAALLPMEEIESLLRMDENAKKMAVNALCERDNYVEELLKSNKKDVFKNYLQINKGDKLHVSSSPFYGVLFNVVNRYKAFLESCINVYNQNTFCIKISTGCAGKCTYCAIRIARRQVKSKPIDDIMDEFERGLKLGYKHFALLGTDIGDYGRDLGLDLINLLEKLASMKAEYGLKLRNLNPRWLIPSRRLLCKLIDSSLKVIYIQSPVQSGNDRILELMNRGYRARDFIESAAEIRRRFPFVVLRTQIIAGFPTETDAEFQDSLAVVDKNIFDYVDVFRYTPRDHTSAASIEPGVPFDVIMRRYRRLFFKSLFNKPIRKLKAIRRLNL